MRYNLLVKSQVITILLLASLLSTTFLIGINVVQADLQTVVAIVPYTSSADVGQTFIINVTVMDVQDLYGIEATIYWNSSILEPMNFDVRLGQVDGALNGPVFFPPQNPARAGEYVISATSVAPAPSFNGSGNIVRIAFKVTEAGRCNISLLTDLYDYPHRIENRTYPYPSSTLRSAVPLAR